MAGPDWKNSATDPILRFLDESDAAISVGGITVNLQLRLERPPSRSTVTRAMSGLKDVGLVEKAPEGKTYYRITDRGRAYLRGELDAAALDADDEG